jgi:hypothetical protein
MEALLILANHSLPDCVGTEMTIQDDLLDATAARGIIWYN